MITLVVYNELQEFLFTKNLLIYNQKGAKMIKIDAGTTRVLQHK